MVCLVLKRHVLMLPPIKREPRRRDNGAPSGGSKPMFITAAQRRRWCLKHGRTADSSLSLGLHGRFSKLAQKIAESEQPWLNTDTKEQDSQPLPFKWDSTWPSRRSNSSCSATGEAEDR